MSVLFQPKFISSQPFFLDPLPDKKPRHGGLHLSTVIQDWGCSTGRIKRRKGPEPIGLKEAYWEEGFILEDLWEERYEARLKARNITRLKLKGHRIISQRGLCEDNIHMTPDGIFLADDISLLESKYTRSRKPELEETLLHHHWAWGVATKCYCRALRINTVRFIVFWAGGWKPECIEYVLEYQQEDMDHTWGNVLAWRDRMVEEGRITC